MKDRIFEHSLNVIRKYLKEDGGSAIPPTNNLGSGKIAGTPEAGDGPPVNLDLRKKKYKNLPGPFKDLFRSKKRVQPKQYPR